MLESELKEFTDAFIEAAMFYGTDGDSDRPLSETYTVADIDRRVIRQIQKDCRWFFTFCENWVTEENFLGPARAETTCVRRAGIDFYLTRTQSGSGFWDGSWVEEIGKKLTVAATMVGPFELYPGDDGKLYGYPPPNMPGFFAYRRRMARQQPPQHKVRRR